MNTNDRITMLSDLICLAISNPNELIYDARQDLMVPRIDQLMDCVKVYNELCMLVPTAKRMNDALIKKYQTQEAAEAAYSAAMVGV